jgi:hypothetical protein
MPGMSHTITITAIERAPFASTKVDREAGHIDGVLICGLQSRNGRDYPTSVLSRDFARYEGAAVNCDHADESTVGRRLGWFSDVKPGADGRPRGRLNLLKSHPMSAAVFEAAERNPSLFGMSHVAVCGTRRINGRETVESINKVLSIDLVADPATTKSLYESYHPQRPPMLFKAFAEQVSAKWPEYRPALVKFLREEMGDVPMDMPPEMDTPTADDPVKAAFSQAMHALVDQFDGGALEGPALLSKLKTLMKAAEKMNGKEAEPEVEEPAEVSEPPEMESLRTQLAAVIKENAELKLNTLIGDTPLSPVQRKAVGLLTEEADRKALIESLKAAAKTTGPKSGEQNTQRKLTESAVVPADGKAFAEFIR